MAPDEDWRLPFDVVSSIMAVSSPPTVSALMRSCYILYEEGPRHLLCDGVVLHSEDVVRFTNFMLTKDPSRLSLLRKLELAFSFMDLILSLNRGIRQHLGRLLSQPALGLETLVVRGASSVLSDDSSPPGSDALCSAFGKLDTLKHLVLLGVTGDNALIIRTLPSKLESVSISLDHRHLFGGLRSARFDVLPTLQPFSGTLHTIHFRLEPSSPALSLLANAGSHAFPHVRTFGIVPNDSVTTLFASPAFAQAFPALRHLQLIPPTDERYCFQWNRRLETARRLRASNQAWRSERHGRSAFPALQSLVECSGRLFEIYALALDHPLATLRLWQRVDPEDIPILREVLEDTHPAQLCISLDMSTTSLQIHAGATSQLLALRALLARPPPRVDLTISLPPAAAAPGMYTYTGVLTEFSRFSKALIQPFPAGLAELNLFIEFPSDAQPVERSETRRALAEFAKWASTAAPSLRLSCRVAVDSDWQWPDLGQDDRLGNALFDVVGLA
ncbi:hypothetical protein GSI_05042 [Ganoderma sinense ZZ0214-1]|uniref:F-box domain-containing protein n=1 Tax=Ganoderma sinense ZZ0214-1 TaxID=1077348 RepID=A0A2G8SGM3_9APHY|nr:hypothetical protein GSI_05042 [Ganoderma sinense ZZ0214-1]